MKEYKKTDNYKLYQGNMLDMLDFIEKDSIDSIVCDPPYGLTSITKRFGKENSAECKYGKDGSFQRLSKGFMGKEWDGSGIEYNVEAWQKCLEVLKPGGYLLAFGGTRTFHRIACAIEDAGFEIRDTIMWIYGSGFPKSLNIGLAIDKKNGVESIDTGVKSPNARPNCDKTNTLYESGTVGKDFTIKKANNEWDGWGTCLKPAYEPIIVARKPFKGSLVDNVLENGVGGLNIDECRIGTEVMKAQVSGKTSRAFQSEATTTAGGKGIDHIGRFPANLILTYDENDKEEVCGGFPNSKDEDSASRYFYCAKASKKDRDEGLNAQHNTHPTVKPCNLMQYLVRLVSPKGAVILDPFMGSGSTGKAVMYENNERNAKYKFVGIEMTEEYLPIAQARIDYAAKQKQLTLFDME